MTIETFGNGGWVATGKDIDLVRLLALRGRLHLEMIGLRFRGQATSNIVRQLLGTKERSRAKLYQMLCVKIDEEKRNGKQAAA